MIENLSFWSIVVGCKQTRQPYCRSVFEFTDNSEELISAGLNWDDPAFADSYKINLWLVQPAVLPL
jgi:hypothetical protein